MTKTLIGLDYEGVPCIKITKGDIDPVTTVDSTPYAFLFNSKDAVQTQLNKVEKTNGNADNGFYPAGSNVNNFTRYRDIIQEYPLYFFKPSYFEGLQYNIPLTSFIPKDPSNGWYLTGSQRQRSMGSVNYQSQIVSLVTPPNRQARSGGWITNFRYAPVFGTGIWPFMLNYVDAARGTSDDNDSPPPPVQYDFAIWNLPGDNTPLPVPLPIQPGQKSIKIDSQGLKIAKPGYDVDSATENQLAVSSNLRPAKIVAANDIAIPVGSSEFILPVSIPSNSICDIQYYNDNELVYPALPRQTPLGANWQLLTDRIRFQNNGIACRARFVVIVNDKFNQTSGNNNVFRQFEENGQNIVQFIKPGAANPPEFSDIIIDSRWPALRILKEGYFEVPVGAQITNIPMETTEGYFPFIKFMVIADRGLDNSFMHRPPTVSSWRTYNSGWFIGGETTYVKVTSNNLAFHTFRGNVQYQYYTYNSSAQQFTLRTTMPDEVVAIRYYVFGIPQS